jgi:hypothetical protein
MSKEDPTKNQSDQDVSPKTKEDMPAVEKEITKIGEPGKTNLKKMICDWHDRIKPKYVFLNETSATPYGWLFKEVWKEAYGDESLPNFYRIEPNTLVAIRDGRVGTEEYKKWREYFDKRVKDLNAKVIVFDEEGVTGLSLFEVEMALTGHFGHISGTKDEEKHVAESSLKPENIYLVDSAPCSLPRQKNTTSTDRYRLITTKEGIASMARRRGSGTDYYDLKNHPFTAEIQRDKEKKKKALEWIEIIKREGKEIGKELQIELEKEQE